MDATRTLSLFALVLLGSCSTIPERDLSRSPDLYRTTGYEAQHPTARKVYVLPVLDRRSPLEPFAEGMYPIIYTQDRFWARPIPVMLGELLEKEVEGSGLFSAVVDREEEADWVLLPVLLEFHGAVEQRIAKRVARGRTKLRILVFGPRGEDGKREKIREKTYLGPVDTTPAFRVPDPHALAAASFARAVFLALADLDRGGQLADGLLAEPPDEGGRERPWTLAAPGK